ncbi:MAG TPA: fibronectin type III domain-containing protein, partial [Chitinophagaceae bacterium]|nr:fibronectin type III domain-containing protein [Chitinophagaceae bacterium]
MRILYTFVFLLCTLGFLNAQEVTIGSGTAQGVLPVEVYYGYTYSQVIYPSSEIGYSGNITGLKFYLPAAADISYSNEWVVYLGLTSKTSFTSDADWIATGSMTQVFSGTVTNSSGVVSITFPAFAYNTSYNLVIAVDENKDDYNDLDDEFYVHTGVTNNTIFYISDVTNPNPASPPLGTRTILRSNVTIVGIGSSCVAPSALTSSNITSTTADISWTPPSPAPSNGYEWEVRTSGVGGSGGSGLAASGSTVAGDTDDNVTGLTANTNYTLWVRSNCGGSGYSAWAGPASFTTSCGTTTVPYTQDFESATVPNLPPCTSQENVGTGNLWETTSSGWANGFDSKCLEYIYSSSEDADVWFYTQGIVMQSSKTYKISYKYGSASFDENLKVAYGTSPDDAAMTNAIADHFDVTTSPLTNEVTFTVPSDGIYYFGFNCYSSADQFALDVDDISITEVS